MAETTTHDVWGFRTPPSWALRALSIHDPQAVRDFLVEYEGRVAARVVREVQHKLTTGLKNPRRTQV